MDIIKRFGLIICLLMVLMAYLKQAIPRGKTTALMKTIISIFILISIVDGIRAIDFERLKTIFDQPYSGVAEDTTAKIEEGLIDEFNSFLMDQSVDARVYVVDINENTEIERVLISGVNGNAAKELLAARYQINKQNIEVKNE